MFGVVGGVCRGVGMVVKGVCVVVGGVVWGIGRGVWFLGVEVPVGILKGIGGEICYFYVIFVLFLYFFF